MYNLIIHYDPSAYDRGIMEIETGRFLEYTQAEIAGRFKELNANTIGQLLSFPTLFAFEKTNKLPARLGRMKDIRVLSRDISFKFEFDAKFDSLPFDKYLDLARRLDIEPKFEVNRSHWAIKNVDLVELFRLEGLQKAHEHTPTTPQFAMTTISCALEILESKTHADIDQLALLLGFSEDVSGRHLGGKKARLAAMFKFARTNENDLGPDGRSRILSIVEAAARFEDDMATNSHLYTSDKVEPRLINALRKDGWELYRSKLQETASKSEVVSQEKLMPQSKPLNPASMGEISGVARGTTKPKVFVVHGRDELLKSEVSRFLEKIGIDAIILHEQPNAGRTLIAKFQEVAAGVEFAVVLMTPDDVGGLHGGDQKPRARQNVIFELGFFISQLGASRVCAIVQGEIEKPSDFDAVVYIQATGNWKSQLARELEAARIEFDLRAAIGS